jgi:LysR family transcriptional regulator, low CO2-responsive transcriptional regulator
MTLTQLRTFVAVAAAGSIHEAAERLCVSQPAVSATVASLQNEVGVVLVAREGRGLRITGAGEVFARYARRVLGLLDEATAAAAGALQPERGKLRLAAVTTAGEHVLPQLLASFRARYPDVEIVLEVGNRTRIRDLLDHHEADLAVGGRPPGAGGYITLSTRPNVLVLVAPAGAGQGAERRRRARTVAVDELAAAVWLLREQGSGTRTTTEELLEELGVSPPTLTVGSNGAIAECVQAGLGISLMSRDAVARELESGLLEEWRTAGLPRPRAWHVVARAGEQLPATAALFVAYLTDPGHLRGPRVLPATAWHAENPTGLLGRQ